MMQEKLKEQDVETVRMQRKQGKTAITYIELLDGDRKFGEDFLNVLEGFQLSDGDLQYLAGFLNKALEGEPLKRCMKAGAKKAALTISHFGAW